MPLNLITTSTPVHADVVNPMITKINENEAAIGKLVNIQYKTLTPTNSATGNIYLRRLGKIMFIDSVLTLAGVIPSYTGFCGLVANDRPIRDVFMDIIKTDGTARYVCIINKDSGLQTMSQSIPAGNYFINKSYIAQN